MFAHVIRGVMEKAGKSDSDVDFIFSGDLLNQTVSSTFSAREFDVPHVGLYSACATMAESLAMGAAFVESGFANTVISMTGSHFSSAERQYRYPLEYGSLRPAFSQWTVTGAGAALVTNEKVEAPSITCATIGKVTDFGILDANNMGAAMAPAAAKTLLTHLTDTGRSPQYYDLILTGDLGLFGSKVLRELVKEDGVDLGENYKDCGAMIYKEEPRIFQGGSGAGCSAVVLNGYIYRRLLSKELNKVLFIATGALLSTITTQQGETIPAIAHAVAIEN